MLATLVVSRRTESTRGRRLHRNPLQISIEGQVEVEPRLFTIGNHIQSGTDLIVNRRDDGVVLQFFQIIRTKTIQMLAGELQPPGKRVTSDHGRSQWNGLHKLPVAHAARVCRPNNTRAAWCHVCRYPSRWRWP